MGETTAILTPDGLMHAYVARPVAERAPAIVVIQEIFGVNAVMRGIADDFAGDGYLAVCPDLFWRIEPGIDISDRSPGELKRAFELFNEFNVETGVRDIAATIDHARGDPKCPSRVGAVGFCLGGLLAVLTAARTDADACVAYYGVGIERYLDEVRKTVTPLLIHLAEEDQFVSKEAQSAIVSVLGGAKNVAIHTYSGRDHAFAREGGDNHHPADAALARERTLAFFRAHL
ncbi:MAG: dienelactone hydrolase family protein [Caulobacteraceae bacterium]|nr:dienelactone hydrolase family protein [Caulobacteraceae bacterium]